jgi:hypothetical protein
VRIRKSLLNTSKGDLSANIIDIMGKPDVAVWNKMVRTRGINTVKPNIGPLDQDLVREDKNIVVDSADEKDVADAIISGTQITDQVDLSKLIYKNK